MKITYLDGRRMYYAFLSGAREVIKNRRELNENNLFPVADGDTGSNLSRTLSVVKNEIVKDNSLKVTLKSMGDAALKGAIGNSGIIFAQFINGLKNSISSEDYINVNGFASAVESAVNYTYQGMSNPVEGTILTVMKAWSESIKNLKDKSDDFAEIMEKSLDTACSSLIETKDKLEVLRKADVVDSGAQAFVYFLQGVVRFIKNGNLKDLQIEAKIELDKIEEDHLVGEEDIKFRYCTEAYIENLIIDLSQLRNKINDLGDSIITAGDKNKMRLHIHTNEPAEFFARLDKISDIIDQKADDMQLQYNVKYNRKSKIAIVTDSIADLPSDIIDKNQIHVIPLNILIDGTNYLDKLTLNSSKFFQMLDQADEYPSSAQPTIKSVENKFAYLADHYDSIIAVTVSSQMSGTYDTFAKAAENITKENKDIEIAVIDSKTNSGAQGLLVIEAAEQVDKGSNFEETVDYLKNIRENIYIYVSVDDFKYMVKGGRVSPLKGKLATILNLKPIISIDREGNGIAFAKAFSKRGNFKKISSILEKHQQNKGIKRYAVVHGDDKERAEKYKKSFNKLLNEEVEFIEDISPIVAINAGRGSTAVALIEREEG